MIKVAEINQQRSFVNVTAGLVALFRPFRSSGITRIPTCDTLIHMETI